VPGGVKGRGEFDERHLAVERFESFRGNDDGMPAISRNGLAGITITADRLIVFLQCIL
jgi:hypothetical protein